jgi:hypothetical protein
MLENTTTTKGVATPENISQISAFGRVSDDGSEREIRVFKQEVAILRVAGNESNNAVEITLERGELLRLGSACLALADELSIEWTARIEPRRADS